MFKFGGGVSSRSVGVFRLRYLNKVMSSQIYKKPNCQLLAPDGSKSATACITSLCITSLCIAYEIVLVDFNMAVSTLTAKLPNLIPRLIFQLYGILRAPLKNTCNQHFSWLSTMPLPWSSVTAWGVVKNKEACSYTHIRDIIEVSQQEDKTPS